MTNTPHAAPRAFAERPWYCALRASLPPEPKLARDRAAAAVADLDRAGRLAAALLDRALAGARSCTPAVLVGGFRRAGPRVPERLAPDVGGDGARRRGGERPARCALGSRGRLRGPRPRLVPDRAA